MKVDQNKKSLGAVIPKFDIEANSSDHFNDEMPLEDYSDEALAEHMKKNHLILENYLKIKRIFDLLLSTLCKVMVIYWRAAMKNFAPIQSLF